MIRRFKTIHGLLVVTVLLGIFAAGYYFYFRVRESTTVFATVTIIRPEDVSTQAPFNWTHDWIAREIRVGDREISPFGEVKAQVYDVNSYEGGFDGRFVYVVLKMNTIRDRSGQYLYKNKPISVGSLIDVKLNSTAFKAYVIAVGKNPPQSTSKLLIVNLYGKRIDWWIAENLKLGSEIVDGNGKVIGKIIKYSSVPSYSGGIQTDPDPQKRDLYLQMKILVRDFHGTYYFEEEQKVKVHERLFLPFRELNIEELFVTSIGDVLEAQTID
ncbi:hypothetical protein HYW55_01790 [Candidatus Gottesmanbacteria bacterium]|nr:hypothetical protein [Candidatus Gottesmanbacteria bacterium]